MNVLFNDLIVADTYLELDYIFYTSGERTDNDFGVGIRKVQSLWLKEHQKVLRWWFDKLDPCLEDLNPIVLKDLGLCTYLDATDFVTANMTKTRQLAIWTSIMDIAFEDDDEQSDVMLLERCQHHESFIESISETVKLDKFLSLKLEILAFHLEKENKKLKGKEGGIPTVKKLRETFIRGLELKADLMRNEDRKESENIAYDDIFDAVNKRCEELKDKIPLFEMKHKIEVSSWLSSSSNQTSKTKLNERIEILAAEEVVATAIKLAQQDQHR